MYRVLDLMKKMRNVLVRVGMVALYLSVGDIGLV